MHAGPGSLMCRSITPLRGLEPPASAAQVRDAASQFVGKVGALSPAQRERPEAQRAIEAIAQVVEGLLDELPARRRASSVSAPRRRLGNKDAPEAPRGETESSQPDGSQVERAQAHQ